MVKDIKIQNFKSVVDLDFPLGRFNVMIGANGCGKSNILEAITFASAASMDQLDVHDLEKRGMRVPAPKFMYPAFENDTQEDIRVSFQLNDAHTEYFCMRYSNDIESGRWIEQGNTNGKIFLESLKASGARSVKEVTEFINSIIKKDESKKDELINLSINANDDKISFGPFIYDKSITSFKIYSPNEKSLRRFDNPDNTVLGVDGTGLFSYLKKIAYTEKGNAILGKIAECMGILDWFDGLKIPSESLSGDNSIMLYDHYIDQTLNYFDQRSANEAFLYLLFYYTLFISENTPPFFAIDNIESALNPKLCREFTRNLIELSEIHDKQVIVTTHNPFVLDALNLTQDNQRLFVVRRDIDGHTRINRIKPPEGTSIPLSEAWMKGYIGGLPDNF